ncbi:hypothetical protein [Flagellimonas allohymeniacidonis]|uniref:Lipoprotein n=1 Tax=Flagellimonas allohymeniacidonis TaxID=2517819 RepID=A0A4Q8QEX4_9FLAO|nr:hypothetical protein [Allomuricauda hymeniacidonis]TAI47738.1 hypothetical protein EW142_13855 [Allomuricauda hymeniacidonis]
MKFVVITLFLWLVVACSPTDNSGEPENIFNGEDIPVGQQLGKDEILFTLRVMQQASEEKDVCGTAKNNVFTIEVMEVLQYGSSVRQRLTEEQQVEVVFLMTENTLENGMVIEAKARETLCANTTSTYFTVIAHKILD